MVWWLIALVAVVIALFALDRCAMWAQSRGWIYWRGPRRGGGVGAAMLGEFESLLSPSNRHTVEEIQSKRIGRVDLTASEGGKPAVDLDRGVVWLPRGGVDE